MISLVIPTKNKAFRLRLTLAALVAQTDPALQEIVIVEDGSVDETKDVINEFSALLPLHCISGKGKGRAASRNLGASAAKGEVLIFVDDDILTVPSFITEHRKAQKAIPGLVHGRLREMVGVTDKEDPRQGGPGVLPFDLHKIMQKGFSPHGYRLLANNLERTVEMLFDGKIPRFSPWLAGAGANVSLNKNTWEAVGGFNEEFGTTWGCEDLEFAFRLYKKGVPISFSREAFGVHLSHGRDNKWETHSLNLEKFMRIHPFPEIEALPQLLGPNGSPECYIEAMLHHVRSA